MGEPGSSLLMALTGAELLSPHTELQSSVTDRQKKKRSEHCAAQADGSSSVREYYDGQLLHDKFVHDSAIANGFVVPFRSLLKVLDVSATRDIRNLASLPNSSAVPRLHQHQQAKM